VAEAVDALANGELPAGVLALDLLGSAHAAGQRLPPAQLFDLRLPGHARGGSAVMKAIDTVEPAVLSRVAMRRPGWTASLAGCRRAPKKAAVRARSATVHARPTRLDGPTPDGRGGPTTSRITSPSLKKACWARPASRVRRRSMPASSSRSMVRPTSGVVTTRWSRETTPLGWSGVGSAGATGP